MIRSDIDIMERSPQPAPFLAHISADGQRTQSVRDHLLGTAALAEAFARPFGGQEQAYLAGLLHDIGKYSGAFQQRLQGGPKVDHATAGAKVALDARQPEVAFAIAGHHGGLPDGGAQTDPEGAGTLLGRLKKKFPPCDGWKKEISPPAAHRPPLPGDGFTTSFYTRMLYSCLVDADYLDTEAFMNGAPAPRGGGAAPAELLRRLQTYIAPWWDAKNELNRKRCSILRACLDAGENAASGLFALTVPTGGGKTVSSLAFALAHAVAQGKTRVIYVIPYTSIIDQTAEVFRGILGAENVVEHHSGADFSMPEGEFDPRLYRKALATENWDAPVIVTTAVQFFESLYGNRASRCRKLHNIAGSVVVFDEAQTMPVPYLRPCVAAVGQLVQYYGVTAVLCTATQPALQPLFDVLAPGLKMREICPDIGALYKFFRRTNLQQTGELTAGELTAQLCAVPQALCVVNRRSTAQQLFATLPAGERYCLTTLLCPADRKRLLKEIRARLKDGLPCRVVSTSLIEAGVDVDFPAAWREEAGLDSILQTAGRCNREGKKPAQESIVTVFRLNGQRTPAMIRQNVDSTRRVLALFADPSTPEAIESYFSFYRTLKGDDALDRQNVLSAFNKGLQGRFFPLASVAEQFHLIDSGTATVYLPVDEGAQLTESLRRGAVSRTLFRRLGQFAVNVYPDHLQKLLSAGAVEAIGDDMYILTDLRLYDRETGLSLDIETGQGWFV